MPGTRKLGRTTDHRKAILRAMVTYLLENGKIETTVTRAKEVRAMAEKMITTAKTNDLHSKRQVLAYVTKEDVVKKLFDTIAPEYADRNGGYTRMYKLGPRRGDGAEMALIKLVADGKVGHANAKKILEVMFDEDIDPAKYAEENGYIVSNDTGKIEEVIRAVVASDPKTVSDYKGGKEKALMALFGRCMKDLRGNCDPQVLRELLLKIINE